MADHILYAADNSPNVWTKRGGNTIVDILVKSGLLENTDGHLSVSVSQISQNPSVISGETAEVLDSTSPEETVILAQSAPAVTTPAQRRHTSMASIAINVQLQLPETENPVVYENLFKALRKHLLDPSSKDE